MTGHACPVWRLLRREVCKPCSGNANLLLLVFHLDRLHRRVIVKRRKREQQFSLSVWPQVVKGPRDGLECFCLFEDVELRQKHGAVARNLKAEVEVSLTQTKTTFPKYTDYVFDDPTRKFNADKQVLFDKTVDENGKAIRRIADIYYDPEFKYKTSH